MAVLHIWIAEHVSIEYVPQLYHLLSFFSGGLCLWMTWAILKWFKIDKSWIVGLLLLIASSPLFSARITMACIQYYISVPLFLLGVVFFLCYVRKSIIAYRICSFLFFLSSLAVWLVAIAMIPAFLIMMTVYLDPESISGKKVYLLRTFKRLMGWTEFLLLPIIAWIMRLLWLLPTEVYESAYALSFKKIVSLPLVILQSFIDSTVGYLGQCFNVPLDGFSYVALLVVIVLGMSCAIYRILRMNSLDNELQSEKGLLWTGLWFYIPAILATSSMGPAVFNSYSSRYQSLLLIPVALLLFWMVLQFKTIKQRKIVLGLLVSLGILCNIHTQIQFQKGWLKSSAIVHIIKNDPQLTVPYTNTLVLDLLIEYNPYNIPFDYYVFTGISKLALNGDQSHFYTDTRLKNFYLESPTRKVVLQTLYNCKDGRSVGDIFDYQLILDQGKMKLHARNTLKLLWQYYMNRPAFERSLNSLIDYQVNTLK